jgi:hypothetical protein
LNKYKFCYLNIYNLSLKYTQQNTNTNTRINKDRAAFLSLLRKALDDIDALGFGLLLLMSLLVLMFG